MKDGEEIRGEKCDRCQKEALCMVFLAEDHYFNVSLCKACLFDMLKELWDYDR